jgi:iron complex transport system substrate-binding protein
MRKTIFVSLIFSLVLVACGAPAPVATLPAPEVESVAATVAPLQVPQAVFPLEITDGLQRTISLDAPAQRIVSLAASNTELLFAVGAGGQIVGRDPYSDFPAEAQAITDIGDTFVELNTELIISLEPDLVLAAEITPVDRPRR